MSRHAEHPLPHERDAARRYLEHSHAAEHLSGHAAEQANRHATAIDEEHPRARDIALAGTERELGKLPSHLRRHQLAERKRAGLTREQLEEIRREIRRPPAEPDDGPGERSGRERAREAAGAAAGRAGQLASTAYDAAADTSWGELLGQLVLGGIVLSILYLFLDKAAGAAQLFKGASNVVHAVVAPGVDPLNPKGALR